MPGQSRTKGTDQRTFCVSRQACRKHELALVRSKVVSQTMFMEATASLFLTSKPPPAQTMVRSAIKERAVLR
jgi:hypothetical protein